MQEEKHETFYKNIEKVFCPYFKEDIHFTETGLDHLKFKNKNTARTLKDQNMRLRLLPVVIQILKLSHTLQGKSQRQRFEERFVNNRKEKALVVVTYYEFIAILDDQRVKVVLKQIADGNKIFLSVIPFFKQKSPPIEGDGFS